MTVLQSTIADAEKWREVVDDLAQCGVDRDVITPEWLIAAARKQLHIGQDYYLPEYAGFVLVEDYRR